MPCPTSPPGSVLTVPYEEAEQLVQADPMRQLPGEGDDQYAQFISFIHFGKDMKIKQWHEKHCQKWSIKTVYQVSRMFLWRKRRIVRMQQAIEQAERASRHKLFETHNVMLEVSREYVEKLILAGMTEANPVKAKALLDTAKGLQANVKRNQEANSRTESRERTEMARIKAAHVTETEDLD